MIKTKGLTKMYDNVHGIKNIDLTIDKGTSMGLLGRNGAGKTTLVRTLIGLLKPDSGEAMIDGIDVIKDPASIRKMIGYLPESFGLYNDMTVYDILDYTAKLQRMEKAERAERIEALLNKFEISDIRGMKTGALSKGLRQKVGFARALVNEPRLIFLDEPTTGLDPIAARGIENLVLELKKEGRTLLITSHILSEAEKMCDSVTLIKEGRLVASGKMDDVKKKYSDPSIMFRLQDRQSADQAKSIIGTLIPCDIENSDNRITIYMKDPDKITPVINKKLVEANIPVLEIRTQESSLDDVYFKAMEE
jgi:ABC-2 type transport system ATP-binding protein